MPICAVYTTAPLTLLMLLLLQLVLEFAENVFQTITVAMLTSITEQRLSGTVIGIDTAVLTIAGELLLAWSAARKVCAVCCCSLAPRRMVQR